MLKRNEDLFAESSMSFGDHLEELRICLWRAIFWLFGGFLIGLYFGGDVVAYIQKPLQASLKKYHSQRGEIVLKGHKDELIQAGYSFDWLVHKIREGEFTPEVNYIYPGQLEGLLDSYDFLLNQPGFVTAQQQAADTVDNLNHYKHTLDPKGTRQQFQPRVHIAKDAKPFPWVMFKELDDLSVTRSKALGAHEAFMIFVKAALVVGFVVASPGVFYSIWSFVAAGLYYHERKYVYMFMPFSISLFIAGAALAFFVVFRFVLDFLFAFNAWMDIDPDTRISEWMSFALMLPVGFGISFQLPLVLFVLERVGILTLDIMISKWKIAVLIIVVISVLLTPSDPYSMLLMAVPLTVLYFFGIALCYVFPKKKSEFDT
ncbi:MAG: twin-arginine translocase subunit TatC [Planctomycetaceae bacterium]|nr:twin-arginine translocase subunit TatC [Planctomycetaceae bacterium]